MAYPPVTLYIPAYNASDYLKKTLPAICALDYPALEKVYIINDGSRDKEDLLSLKEKYDIELINKTNNEGLAAARNTALSLCKTELIASLDADCLPDKNWLKCLVDRYLREQSRRVTGVGGKLEEKYHEKLADLFRSRHMIQHHGDSPLFNPEFLAGNNTLLNCKILQQIGGYPEKGIYRTNHEDYAISRTIKKSGYYLFYDPAARVRHLRQDNLSSIFKTFWRWYFLFHPDPQSIYNVLNKFRRQWIHHALPWFIQDCRAGQWKLAGVDIIFPFYQSWLDWQYYFRRNNHENPTS